MAQKKRVAKSNAPKSRKEQRKEQRKQKKVRKNDYFTSKNKSGSSAGKFVKNPNKQEETRVKHEQTVKQNTKKPKETKNNESEGSNPQESIEKSREKEKRIQLDLERDMKKQRSKQLLEANIAEDKTIKRLEKLLNLNKRKSKAVPKSFATDGLDYLLEVCGSENFETSVKAEQQFHEANDDFDEDFALMTGLDTKEDETDEDFSADEKPTKKTKRKLEPEGEIVGVTKKKQKIVKFETTDESDSENFDDEEVLGEEDYSDSQEEEDFEEEDFEDDLEGLDEEEEELAKEHLEVDDDSEESDEDEEESDENVEESSNLEQDKYTKQEDDKTDTWEDIYGRKRAPDGSIIKDNTGKYIPPAARAKLEERSDDKQRNQKLDRLKKQLKGLLNRLAESNMHNISTQIEDLYMNNSRNDMNETLTELIIDALVSNILAPERLLLEHVVLISILHANIGTEVGGHFLQTIVDMFHTKFEDSSSRITEDKSLDNLVVILSQLYNFKMFDSKLIYEILDKLSEKFDEKDVGCILHILRNVGFNLRKDNPISLKNLILNLQKRASQFTDEFKENARVKFMLDILLAIKNNNVSKIPNYDTSYAEHLKKITKGFIRKGNYVTQLNISLDDLLNVETRGRWWIVGSAWTGNIPENNEKPKEETQEVSQKLLDLAKKQRMNTDVRKNIFCIIMSAEDYVDAFEKLLKLSLKSQDREIIHVLLHCCMQEKKYNPYYAVLAQRFCEHDRKYQMTIKYSIWDKLKALNEQSSSQTSNLAKLLGHLIIEKGLPLSILKVMQFGELDKISLRFIRQILLGILLHEDNEACKEVFEKIAHSEKLKMFRESLRLFVHHFLLKNLNERDVQEDKKKLLQERVRIVVKVLQNKSVF